MSFIYVHNCCCIITAHFVVCFCQFEGEVSSLLVCLSVLSVHKAFLLLCLFKKLDLYSPLSLVSAVLKLGCRYEQLLSFLKVLKPGQELRQWSFSRALGHSTCAAKVELHWLVALNNFTSYDLMLESILMC